MARFINFIRKLLVLVIPFVCWHFYLEHFYKLGLHELLLWWVQHPTKIMPNVINLAVFAVSLIVFLIASSKLLTTISYMLMGYRRTMIYLGNNDKYNRVYYRMGDKKQTVVSAEDRSIKYSFRFNELYTTHRFLHLPDCKTEPGEVTRRFHPFSILAAMLALLAASMLFSAGNHAISFPAYKAMFGAKALLQGDILQAYGNLLTQLYLDLNIALLVLVGSLIAAVLLSVLTPNNKPGAAIIKLPEEIKPGTSINGIPIEIEKVYGKVKDTDGTIRKRDTGKRMVTFEFSDEFNPAVYLTDSYNAKENKLLGKTIEKRIEGGLNMGMTINEDLSVSMMDKKPGS